MYISVNQKDKKHFKFSKFQDKYMYSRTRILVGKIDGNDDEIT